jgi:hypothetical protein
VVRTDWLALDSMLVVPISPPHGDGRGAVEASRETCRHFRLLILSVMKKRSVVVAQTFAAVDVRCVSFLAGGRRRSVYFCAQSS